MIKCQICNIEFSNNLGGQLTNHLSHNHNMTMEDYVVKIEYNGSAPKCVCGLCDERPVFDRGKFKKYALNHESFESKERLFIKKFGQPKCSNCTNDVRFHRGKPQKFCSQACCGKQNGFSKPETQTKIRQSVLLKYGVDNVSKLATVRQKISDHVKIREPRIVSKETCEKQSIIAKKRWENPEMRVLMINGIKEAINSNQKELKRRSEYQIKRMNDSVYTEKLFGTCWGKFSKLHQKIRAELNLNQYGFKSEQIIGKRIADELDDVNKIIIEINGDYIHANPKKYQPYDLIRIPGDGYLAKDKWRKDKNKIRYLESKGYRVFVIWESDDLNEWKEKLRTLYTAV